MIKPVRRKKARSESGATIIVVAITLVALVAMAALALDVASLYIARSEAQRAADAAALAGAKMFVNSGITSVVGISPPPLDQSSVCQDGDGTTAAAANIQAAAAISQNLIGGQTAIIQSITCDFSLPENPRITVKVRPVTMPTFFAKIWGGSARTVTATAMAEAYNQSGSNTPPVLTSVEPWVLPNCDPTSSTGPCTPGYFVDALNGTPKSSPSGGSFVGTQIRLNRILKGAAGGGGGSPPILNFYALDFPDPPADACPSCGQTGVAYVDNIACSSQAPLQCGQQVGPGLSPSSPAIPVEIISETGFPTRTRAGGRCLIHAARNGLGQGQDSFSSSIPNIITGGSANPNRSLRGITNISRSDSVVTVPLYDGQPLCDSSSPSGTCSVPAPSPAPPVVLGFLQLGIQQTLSGSGTVPEIQAVILNIVGCTPTAVSNFNPNPANGITSNSAIPVRLVRNP